LRVALLGDDFVFDRRKGSLIRNGKDVAELEAIVGVRIRSGVVIRKYRRIARYELRLLLEGGASMKIEDNLSVRANSVAKEIAGFLKVPITEQ
jgi:hypothetical protein